MGIQWSDIEYPYDKPGRIRGLWFLHFLGVSGVFPCAVIKEKDKRGRETGKWKKQPFPKEWQIPGKGAAKSLETVDALWSQSPRWSTSDCGVLLGKHVLIDLDRKEGTDGIQNFKELVSGLGLDLIEAVSGCYIWSTPGRLGGIHILALSSNRRFTKHVPRINGQADSGVEVLGKNAYFLSPGSKRPDKPGGKYELLQVPETLTELPSVLWDALTQGSGSEAQPLSDETEAYLNRLMTEWFEDWRLRRWDVVWEWLDDAERKERPNGGWLLVLPKCPFVQGEERVGQEAWRHNGSAAIGVWNGQLHFLCKGARCAKRNWSDFQKLIESDIAIAEAVANFHSLRTSQY